MALIRYVGNFGPEHSTENDLRRTLEAMGHGVMPYQEDSPVAWAELIAMLKHPAAETDLVLWTSTYEYAQKIAAEVQREMQWLARNAGVPTIGFHLDRWWGLDRWKRVLTDPFFRCDYVLTADGGHQDAFEAAGVNHLWSPPAIAPHNAVLGTPRPEFAHDIVFVGSWQGGYHDEWQHRRQLVKHLQRKWADHVEFYPRPRHEAIRGRDLADLYASAKVVVGDSCLVPKLDGSEMTHYCSDRVFETIGRGGLLIHPHVFGITGNAVNTLDEAKLEDGHHLLTWQLGNWEQLDENIQWALDNPDEVAKIRQQGFDHVTANHTYASRLDWALGLVGL